MGVFSELMVRHQEINEFIEESNLIFGENNIIVVENESITIDLKNYLR